jgi:WD40 repeat protein
MHFEGDYGRDYWITSITEIGNGHFAVSNRNKDLTLIDTEDMVQGGYRLTQYALPEIFLAARADLDDSLVYAIESLDESRFLVHASAGMFVFDTENEIVELLLPTLEGEFTAGYAYSAATEMLVVGTLGLWQAFDVAENEVMLDVRLENAEARIFSFDFNPDGSRFVSLQTDGRITIWDTASGEAIVELGAFERAVGYKWG